MVTEVLPTSLLSVQAALVIGASGYKPIYIEALPYWILNDIVMGERLSNMTLA
jgi:hypothetical protein